MAARWFLKITVRFREAAYFIERDIEMSKYTYDEAGKILGITGHAVGKLVSKYKLKREYVRNSLGKGNSALIDDEALEFLKNRKRRKTNPERKFIKRPKYWKVSVADKFLNRMIIKHVCLTKREAVKIAKGYIANGLISRASPH